MQLPGFQVRVSWMQSWCYMTLDNMFYYGPLKHLICKTRGPKPDIHVPGDVLMIQSPKTLPLYRLYSTVEKQIHVINNIQCTHSKPYDMSDILHAT